MCFICIRQQIKSNVKKGFPYGKKALKKGEFYFRKFDKSRRTLNKKRCFLATKEGKVRVDSVIRFNFIIDESLVGKRLIEVKYLYRPS